MEATSASFRQTRSQVAAENQKNREAGPIGLGSKDQVSDVELLLVGYHDGASPLLI